MPCAGPHALKSINRNPTYSYDANGNMALRDGRAIRWNYENQPLSVQTPQGGRVFFQYDAWGQRVTKEAASGTTYYFSPQLEFSDGTGLTKYYRAGSRLVAKKDSSGTFWYHQNPLASTQIITNDQGAVVQRYSYRPFGEKEKSSATFANSIYFTGQRTEEESGLVYMNGRYYDPWLAKFISADPIIPDPTNPQAFNRYSYVYNNPLSYVDPSGYHPEEGSDPSEWISWEEATCCPGALLGEEVVVYGYSDPLLVSATEMQDILLGGIGTQVTDTWGIDFTDPTQVTDTWGIDLADPTQVTDTWVHATKYDAFGSTASALNLALKNSPARMVTAPFTIVSGAEKFEQGRQLSLRDARGATARQVQGVAQVTAGVSGFAVGFGGLALWGGVGGGAVVIQAAGPIGLVAGAVGGTAGLVYVVQTSYPVLTPPQFVSGQSTYDPSFGLLFEPRDTESNDGRTLTNSTVGHSAPGGLPTKSLVLVAGGGTGATELKHCHRPWSR